MVSRRSVLVGLGGLVAGGGALIGTGAFTTVEAQRTVNVQTTGDASAFLALEAVDRNGGQTQGDNNPYVTTTSDDTIQINLNGSGDSNVGGLNQDARTRFENLVKITNNGTQDISAIEFQVSASGGGGTNPNDALEQAFKITDGDNTLNPMSDQWVGIGGLTSGNSTNFGIEINLLDSNFSDGNAIDSISDGASFTLTIRAQTSNS